MSQKNAKLIRKYVELTAPVHFPDIEYNAQHMLTKQYNTGRFNDVGMPVVKTYQVPSQRTIKAFTKAFKVKLAKKAFKQGSLTTATMRAIIKKQQEQFA